MEPCPPDILIYRSLLHIDGFSPICVSGGIDCQVDKAID